MTVTQTQTIFNTPDSTSAAQLLSSLESGGYMNALITGPTIEDMLLRVADEKKNMESGTGGFSAVDTSPLIEPSESADGQLTSGSTTSFYQQTSALLIKRLTILRRSYWWYVLAMAIPLGFTPAVNFMVNSPIPYEPRPCISLEPSFIDDPWLIDLLTGGYSDQAGSNSMSMLVGPDSANDTLFRAISSFPVGDRFEMKNYRDTFIFQDSFDDFIQHVRNKSDQITPGALHMGDKSNTPTFAYNAELGPDVAMLMQNLWSQLHSRIPIALSFAYFSSTIPMDSGLGLVPAILLTTLHIFYPAFFALYPAYERLQKVRALQYSNSVRPCPLWTSHILVDLFFVLIISALSTVIISLDIPKWYYATYLFPVFLLYGLATMIWSYIISLFCRSELAAFGFTLCAVALMFILSVMGFTLAAFYPNPVNATLTMDAVTFFLGLIFPVADLFRGMAVGLNVWSVGCRNSQLITYPGSIYAYCGPILLLCLQVLYLFPALLWLDGQHSFTLSPAKHIDGGETGATSDHDIEMEQPRLNGPNTDLLRMVNVRKAFGSKVVVDDVSLGLGESEILALLGPNGAGKTTITNMMRGEIVPDQGSIHVKGVEVRTNTQTALQHIGGNPTVLILDEPSSAMDAISKREMWKMLSSITPGRSVFLTTHSMEEADELATRVAILSKRILAIGTSQELRQRYSNVYEAHLVLATAPASTRRETEHVEAWIRQTFPDATFEGVNLGGQIRFMIPADSASMGVANGTLTDRRSGVPRLIETLEEQKDVLGLRCYTVGMGTLEMVFLKIVKDCDVPDDSEKSRKWKWNW
ncbi:hypothetical protein QQX98_000959 [Neonectria punicea]|uniref:ABC transporter domain-containing protein n=1 Tax=Neonectria punicea TaxID=979145 RepID=A0ABR1HR67_9HYPO